MGWQGDGIDEERFEMLRYNAASGSLVALFESPSGHDAAMVGSIYVRGRDETDGRRWGPVGRVLEDVDPLAGTTSR